ncbi:mechanosensitive ion channel family protein [Candidatus Poseidoniales archaeon]|jgi:MscS family membrane protein|nr:mechanosensitive ion channel family protein [Euryarchaeota archaeon]MDC3310503.1 mechanosensitive ion channel family protein [Candidatus Poseidoniales archaeon]
MNQLDDFMQGDTVLQGFSQGTIIIFFAIIALSITLGVLSRRYIFPRLMDIFSKTERIDGKTLFAPRSLGWMIGTLVFVQSIQYLDANFTPIWDANLVDQLNDIVFTAFIIMMLVAAYRLVDYLDAFIVVEGDDNIASRRSLASVAESVGRVAVVVIGAFVLAGVAGVDLNGLIAGLGITGLALALAAKDSVSNIFGAVSILIDQPFNVGDWIIVDGVEGEVVNIGLRTTLIRTSADTMITVPNSNMVNSPVENFSKRRFRRITPKFELEEDSSPAALKEFCDVLLKKVNDDARSIKEEDSWVRVQTFGTAMVVVAGNFYCVSSASTQRELNEDILMMARDTAEKLELIFFEPRLRNNK